MRKYYTDCDIPVIDDILAMAGARRSSTVDPQDLVQEGILAWLVSGELHEASKAMNALMYGERKERGARIDPDTIPAPEIDSEGLNSAIEALSENERLVIAGIYFSGLSRREMSSIVPESGKVERRALLTLRQILEEVT